MAKRGNSKPNSKSKSPSSKKPKPVEQKPPRDPSEFCKAMDTWAQACVTVLPTDDEEKIAWRKEFQDHWLFIRRSISKSCLLDRLIYGGEKLRTEMCPEHKGIWSGCRMSGEITCGCGHGICVTGWLKNKEDPQSHNSGLAIATIQGNTITHLEQ